MYRINKFNQLCACKVNLNIILNYNKIRLYNMYTYLFCITLIVPRNRVHSITHYPVNDFQFSLRDIKLD